MATLGPRSHWVSNNEDFCCDACGSKNMKDHELGKVCNDCGIVLEHVVLQYNRPYEEEVLQHSVLAGTTIGTQKERRKFTNSIHLNKLNKIHSIQETEKAVNTKARKEIKRIFGHLHLPASKMEIVFSSFKDLRSKLQSGTKYRSPQKLVPISIFMTMKLNTISINEEELLDVSNITKKEFNSFKLQLSKFIPHYAMRNRKQYILQKIMEIREHFGLDMHFFYTAKSIMYKLWNSISCTKDDVIAGLACSITSLCCYQEREDVSVNGICRTLGIMMSTIQSQLKTKIIEKYKIPNFVSLVKSTDILRKILVALKIIEDDVDNPLARKEDLAARTIVDNDLVQITLTGEGTSIFPRDEEDEYYHFAIKDVNDHPVFIEIKTKLGRMLERFNKRKKSYKRTQGPLFVFNKYRYYRDKGPPLR